MAIDRTYGTTSAPSATDSRLERSLRLDWSAIIGGSLIGWGALLFLSLIGMILGLSVLDPFAARPARSNLGAGLWGAGAAVVASFIGAYFVVRLAGERRRAESLMHGAVAWGLSMLCAGLIALFSSGAAPSTRAPASRTSHAPRGAKSALIETSGNGIGLAALSTGGAVLALVGSLLGALAAASRASGVSFVHELRRGPRVNGGSSVVQGEINREQTTILPPIH
ncbi:MAG: hypothetical protein E6J78_02530 [Deltaproteobacteria bacterium]|nr:MAG: hypothetical protein E6J78_02530 [Deltaproteobacteria bacterium]